MVGGVRVTAPGVDGVRFTPMREGKKPQVGRPAARRAWSWNGVPTLLPLAYTPSGKTHDSARHYLRKRHCLCCNMSGFLSPSCPECINKDCPRCRGGTDRTKVIAAFYLKHEAVPFPIHIYGVINCFLETCPRRGASGFVNRQEMVLHARFRHKAEYLGYLDQQATERADEVMGLRQQVEMLMRNQREAAVAVAEKPLTETQTRMAKARAARKPRAAGSAARQ